MRLPNLFGRRRSDEAMARLVVSTPQAALSVSSADVWQNPTARAAIDAIARAASRFELTSWVTFPDGSAARADRHVDAILRNPNALETGSSLLYRVATILFSTGNAFVLVDRGDDGSLRGLYPLAVSAADFLVDGAGEVYVKMTLRSGRRELLAYSDLVHLKRHQRDSDVMGDGSGPIAPALALAHAQTEGSINAIESSARIRGVLRFTQKLNREVVKENTRQFVKDYLTMANDGGVIAIDPLAEYTPIESHAVTTSADELAATDDQILRFLGVPRAICDGTFTDDEWSAFEESVLEPLARQIAQEMTRKLLGERAIEAGWEIRCGIDSLQFVSNKNKIKLLEIAVPQALLTINEGRRILGLDAIEGGDTRLLSLNYVDSTISREYQLGRAGFGGVKTLKENSRVTEDADDGR